MYYMWVLCYALVLNDVFYVSIYHSLHIIMNKPLVCGISREQMCVGVGGEQMQCQCQWRADVVLVLVESRCSVSIRIMCVCVKCDILQ